MTLIIKTTGGEDYLDGGEGRVKCLIMGPPGVGKTRSASFWPRPLLLDCEDGRMSVADRKIPYGRIYSSSDMDQALDLAVAESNKGPGERRFDTLIIDTLDSYQRVVMQERLRITGNEGFSGWADWGYLDSRMQKLIARLHTIRMNVVVNLHVKTEKVGEDEDGKGGMLVVGPKLKGDMREQITAEFDLVGYMGTYWEGEGGTRVQKRGVTWHPTPDRPGIKDRSGTLPQWTEVTFTDHDYYGLFEALAAKVDDLTDGEVIETLESTVAGVEPVGPIEGGPVAGKHAGKAATKKAAAPSSVATEPPTPVDTASPDSGAAAQPVEPIAGASTVGAGSAPIPAAPAPDPEPVATAQVPAPKPEPEPEPTVEEAVESVAEALGGEVIADPAPAEAAVVTAPVAETPADAGAASSGAPAADGGGSFPCCGDPRDADTPTNIAGCGKVLKIGYASNGDLTIDDPSENPDMITIALLKVRTWLCNQDYSTYRDASKAAPVAATA